jgi:pimeloyl-ACP methyl ester carboxylesterase
MITTKSADGTDVRAYDEGRGRVILVIHQGLDDGKSWGKVAERLSRHFRVVRIVRRQYRLDLPSASPCSITQEVDDVKALCEVIGEPMVIVGHSSGGVVALESLVALPSAFAGAVVFEPPIVTGPSLWGEALERAQAAIAANKPGKAMAIFVHDVVGMPWWYGPIVQMWVGAVPKMRRLAPRQVNDLEAVDRLGDRLANYAHIEVQTVLLGGGRSPAHLGKRLDVLEAVLPHSERVVMERRDHLAQVRAPREVAQVIENLADSVFG